MYLKVYEKDHIEQKEQRKLRNSYRNYEVFFTGLNGLRNRNIKSKLKFVIPNTPTCTHLQPQHGLFHRAQV